jgi:mRNA-degrading endonuclease toxin of MazEF toxin-antitoxin module
VTVHAECAVPAPLLKRQPHFNATSIAVVAPLTNRVKQHIYHSQVEIKRSEGGLKADSVAQCEQEPYTEKEIMSGRRGSLRDLGD